MTLEQERATQKINRIVACGALKVDIADKIGVTPPTLYVRLRKSNWKKGELEMIKSL